MSNNELINQERREAIAHSAEEAAHQIERQEPSSDGLKLGIVRDFLKLHTEDEQRLYLEELKKANYKDRFINPHLPLLDITESKSAAGTVQDISVKNHFVGNGIINSWSSETPILEIAGPGSQIVAGSSGKNKFVIAESGAKVLATPGSRVVGLGGSDIVVGEQRPDQTTDMKARGWVWSGWVTALGSSHVTAYDNSHVYAGDGSVVDAYNGSRVYTFSGANLQAHSGARVFVNPGAHIDAMPGSELIPANVLGRLRIGKEYLWDQAYQNGGPNRESDGLSSQTGGVNPSDSDTSRLEKKPG